MLPLIIGEAPSRTGDRYWQFPLSGAVGQKLCTWAGIEPEENGTRYGRYYWPLREQFDLENLLERYPGARGKGAAFPLELARPAWAERRKTLGGRVVVLLGTRLASVAGIGTFWRWHHSRAIDFSACCVPHPSGLNPVYNEGEARELTGAVLRQAIERART